MTWITIAALILQEGLPVAEAIFKKWKAGAEPTPEDFAELRALASQVAQDRMKLALTKAGIPLDSEQAITLLALTV